MSSIIIVGHKNPDTDTVVASLVWGDYLKRKGYWPKVCRAGQLNYETKFVLKYFHQNQPPLIKNLAKKKVFLIDHNEASQAVDGLDKAQLVGILDHHKLGGLKTAEPIFCRIEALGSSSTLVAKIFLENNYKLNKKQAGLLLAGIISDTLNFHSPTTTLEDKKIARYLAKISQIKINQLAKEMFQAKSNLAGYRLIDLVTADYKEFEFGQTKFGLGVWETVNPQSILDLKEKIFLALKKLKEKQKIDLVFFAAVDILKQKSFFFLLDEREKDIIQQAFRLKSVDEITELDGIVSRKKQMIPAIAQVLE